MSAHSTVYVTRTKAQAALINHLLTASDEELARLLDRLLDERLLNCRVVPDGDPEAQDYLLS